MRKHRSLLAVCASALALLAPTGAGAADPQAAMYVTIGRGGDSAAPRPVTLPLNKAVIVDLPTDARDVLLSNPDIADSVVRTARRVFILGRKVGQTNAFFFDAQGRQIANLEIRVEPDVSPLNAMLKRFAPNGSVKAESVNGTVVLSGNVKSAAEADRISQIAEKFSDPGGSGSSGGGNASNSKIVNLIAVEGAEQVLVKVRVVEMSRTLVKQLGVNVNAQNILNQMLPEDVFASVATTNGYSIAGKLLGGLDGKVGVADNILQAQTYSYPGAAAGSLNPAGSALVGGYSSTPVYAPDGVTVIGNNVVNGPGQLVTKSQADVAIQAFERAGLLRVLAEPNLTAISGESGKFLAGGEFPVPVQSKDGEVSVEFKPFGVGLAFTPIVMSGGRISLKLSTEVSDLTADGAINTGDQVFTDANGQRNVIRGITIPALQVRRAETTVEMPSGGSLMMAGLIQERTRQALEGIPGAKDLPIFGSLFRSRDFLNNETELVIIVTPYLVEPTSAKKLKTPGDGYMNASDAASFLSGRLNAVYKGGTANTDGKRLQGPAGHVIQ
ncbi:MAG: type II and III secretion system protein family protein [Hyphomonadaceae bacterium]